MIQIFNQSHPQHHKIQAKMIVNKKKKRKKILKTFNPKTNQAKKVPNQVNPKKVLPLTVKTVVKT